MIVETGNTMRRKYDLAISLGGACACSKSLRNAGLQFASFPFDWLYGATFADRVGLMASDFNGWLSEGVERSLEPPLCVGESHWLDKKYGFGLRHDFDRLSQIEVALPEVKKKYARRAERMFNMIGRSNRILMMWTDVPTSPEVTEGDVADLQMAFAKKWPGKTFDILLFKRLPDVPVESMTDVESGSVRIVSFDYMIREISKNGVLLADDDLLGKWLAERYEVPDYRTPEEVARWKRIRKFKKYKEYGGRNLPSYLVGKVQYKIYKHLMKTLQRKGIAI